MAPMPPSRVEVRRDLAVVVLAASALLGVALGARDLWNPNEPVYGQAVAEMAARGDWLVPTVKDVEFAEKPILYFWLGLASSRVLGGVSELSLRLPSAAAGVGGAVLLYLLVVPYAGRSRARLSVALFVTLFAVFWGSRTVQMDILVTTTTLATVLPVTRTLDGRLDPSLGWTLAGVGAALGMLSKALVGVILPAAIVLVWVAVTRRWRRLADPRVLLGVAAFLALAAPWFVWLIAAGKSEFLMELFYRQHFARFVDPWDHARPWWYYAQYLWIDMAPWAWFVPLAVALPERDAGERRLDVLAWIWIAVPILLFSMSASKRSAYILPVAPAVAILASGVAERYLDGRLGRSRARAVPAIVAVFGVVAAIAGLGLWLRAVPRFPDLRSRILAVASLLIAGGLTALAAALAARRAPLAAPAAMFSLVVVLYVVGSTAVLPAVDAYKSARPFTERVASVVGDRPVASFGMWEWRAGYTYYLRRPIPNLENDEQLRAYWKRDEQVFVIVQSTELDAARAVLGDAVPWVEAPVGSRTAYLFSNR